MAPMLKLFGRETSYNVQKVAWVIAELRLNSARVDVGGAFGGLDDPDYIAMNPNRRVPTLIDGDQVLWESNAICRYLVDMYGGQTTLSGTTKMVHAKADMWMEWFQNNVYTDSIALFHQTVKLPPSKRSAEKRASALNRLTNALAIFDAALEGQKFILGDQLSLGDIPTGSFLYRYYTLEIERPPLPHLKRYYDDLKTRPSYQNAVMVDYGSLRGSD